MKLTGRCAVYRRGTYYLWFDVLSLMRCTVLIQLSKPDDPEIYAGVKPCNIVNKSYELYQLGILGIDVSDFWEDTIGAS